MKIKKLVNFTVFKNLKRDKDGWTRLCLDVYLYPCYQKRFVELLNKHTRLNWKWFGTFMDTACFATKDKITKNFKVPYPYIASYYAN